MAASFSREFVGELRPEDATVILEVSVSGTLRLSRLNACWLRTYIAGDLFEVVSGSGTLRGQEERSTES